VSAAAIIGVGPISDRRWPGGSPLAGSTCFCWTGAGRRWRLSSRNCPGRGPESYQAGRRDRPGVPGRGHDRRPGAARPESPAPPFRGRPWTPLSTRWWTAWWRSASPDLGATADVSDKVGRAVARPHEPH